MALTGPTLVLLFNTYMAFGCTSCITLATWPFQGLMMQWFYIRHKYTWTTHTMMTWFLVGCIGLFAINLFALMKFDPDTTSLEGYEAIYLINGLMHFLWGLHQFHLWVIFVRGTDKGEDSERRRGFPILGFSILGSCGTATLRNAYTFAYGANDTVTIVTGVIENLFLLGLDADLICFMIKEHVCGKNKESDYAKELLLAK